MKDQQWKMARDRLLAYLDALQIPWEETIDICNDVLDHVSKEIESNGKGNPVGECMRYLRRMTKSDLVSSKFVTVPKFEVSSVKPPIPGMIRGRMVPEQAFESFLSRITPFWKRRNSFLRRVRLLLLIPGLIFIFFKVSGVLL